MDSGGDRLMADVINCEYFENNWAEYLAGRLDAPQAKALAEHRRNCAHCGSYGAESLRIRESLQALPDLQASPYFASNLMRTIRQLEHGGSRRKWGWEPRLNPLALSAGVAVALLVGFLFLQPLHAPMEGMTSQPTDALQGQAELQNAPIQTAPKRQIVPGTSSELLAASEVETDTAKHRLPEAPGQQRIPIPMEDDLWRLNQASTTPPSP